MKNTFLNFINECNQILDAPQYHKMILQEKDYLNTRGKKKGITYNIALKKTDIKDSQVIIGKISVLDNGKVYININKQKHPSEKDKRINLHKYFIFTDIMAFIESTKGDFYFDTKAKGCYLVEYQPRKIKKESKKVFYKAKFY